MAMKILTSSAEAEEVIQDVFVLVWKNAHKINFEKAKVFTWMAVMMKNRCIQLEIGQNNSSDPFDAKLK